MSTTWRKELETARKMCRDETAIVALAPADDAVWDEEFDPDYGGTEGKPVLAWSEQRVYFPVCYDGSEWLGTAPRNPRDTGQDHVGGG